MLLTLPLHNEFTEMHLIVTIGLAEIEAKNFKSRLEQFGTSLRTSVRMGLVPHE